MKRAILILSIVFLLISNCFAQVWHFTSVISTTNSPVGFVLTPVNEYVGTFSFLTIIPKLTIRQQIYTPFGEVVGIFGYIVIIVALIKNEELKLSISANLVESFVNG